jgi:cob(I)alamin adenosyltransferase|tara:strand:+ start:1097 stop:1615 length:519 start_codon:yes stop_codon:yes gene_type:complete
MTKIYTKQGDQGTTCLPIKGTVSKGTYSIEAIGTVDELNSFIGLVRQNHDNKFHEQIQHDLLKLGAQLSTGESYILDKDIKKIEREIDVIDNSLPELTEFILPYEAINFHLARSVCRRAERLVIKWRDDTKKRTGIPCNHISNCVIYLNRLSDYLFVAARKHSKLETKWQKV